VDWWSGGVVEWTHEQFRPTIINHRGCNVTIANWLVGPSEEYYLEP
jgi:hypothetical protein